MSNEQAEAGVSAPLHSRSLAWGMRWFATALGTSYAVRFIRGAVLPKLLPPLQYGLAMSLLLPLGYLRYTDLGVLDQLAKRLPFYRASEGEERFWRHVSLGAGWTLGTALLVALGVFVGSFWVSGPKADFYRHGLRLVALLVVAQRCRYLLTVVLNTREEFRSSQTGGMLSEATTAGFSILCVALWGPIGMISAMVLSEITVSLYYVKKAGFPALSYAFRPMVAMVREGLLLLSLAAIELMLITVDQFFLLRFFSVEQYGLYLLGGALANLSEILRVLFEAAQPRILSLTGAGRNDEAKTVVSSILSLYSLALVATVGLSVLCTALALRFYLTRYQMGMGLYILMPLMAITRGPMTLLRTYYLSKNQERRLILYEIASLVTMVTMYSLTVLLGWGLVGMALSIAGGCGVASVLMVRQFEGSLWGVLMHFKLYALYVAAALGLVGIYEFWRFTSQGPKGPINLMGLFMATLVYGVAMLAVIYFTRSEWQAALKVVRAQPEPSKTDASMVLTKIAE